ncbi:hypothetical protein LCGC14_0376090 [marine sediment metagenome]|uniref:Uncharacterized protein n=1 Tax=marine sediment metagenome TaxID=412755 RepID=A0A0F9VR13_9ZZZZ
MLTETHVTALLFRIACDCFEDVGIIEEHYTARGIEATVLNRADNKEYILTLEAKDD